VAEVEDSIVKRIKFRLHKYLAHRKQQVFVRRGWYDLSARSEERAIFIGGCGRSGTTLLRELLTRHPSIACGPETSMFGLPFNVDNIVQAWILDHDEVQRGVDSASNLIDFAGWFYEKYLLRVEKKPRWADKTPNNVRVTGKLLTWYPQSRFIHMIRDGRDVVCSLRHHPKERTVNGQIVKINRTNPISQCAARWLNDTAAGIPFRNHPRYLEVRYEDLVDETEFELRRICNFIEEPFLSEMMNSGSSSQAMWRKSQLANNHNADRPVSRTSIGRWQRDLSLEERKIFVDIAGELLIALGYAPDHSWSTAPLVDNAQPTHHLVSIK